MCIRDRPDAGVAGRNAAAAPRAGNVAGVGKEGGMKVLVVVDDMVVRRHFEAALGRGDFAVIGVGGGIAAWGILELALIPIRRVRRADWVRSWWAPET